MERSVQLKIHGKGNAWPVPLGETHPYYNRTNPRELSNAAFSLEITGGAGHSVSILVDAGHGTIQSLISGTNRIPDCICLTHGHMDHTLSVDWIVQSHWRKKEKKSPYPIYASRPVAEFFLLSYPHLANMVDFRILDFGRQINLGQNPLIHLTAYPAFHGEGALGASMLLFETEGRKVLFTGDLLTPLLRKEDYKVLQDMDLLVVDTNNRFPWPRTNHWSFAGEVDLPPGRSKVLVEYFRTLSWDQLMEPYQISLSDSGNREYFTRVGEEWSPVGQPLSIIEFLRLTEPRRVLPVHYSGAEDLKYHQKAVLSPEELTDWIRSASRKAGLKCGFDFPEAGDVLDI